jgi:ribosomal protein S18 acetylase RimI-like enzyme
MGCCFAYSFSKSSLQVEQLSRLQKFDDVAEIPKAEYDQAVDVIARAFSGSPRQEGAADMHWALGPKFDFEHPQRLDLIGFIMKMMLLKYVKDSAVVIGRHEDASGDLNSLVVFTRSPGYRVPPCEALSYVFIVAGMWNKAPQVIKENNGLPPDIQKALEQIGKVEAEFRKKHCSGLHYYIHIVAVDPRAQGLGHSSKMLRRVNELADSEKLPCFLITAGPTDTPKKVAIYSRFGYEVVDEQSTADMAGRSVTFYAMVRKANGNSGQELV